VGGRRYTVFTSLLQGFCNLVACGHGYLYASMALLPRMPAPVGHAVRVWALAWTIGVFPVVGPILYVIKRPVTRALDDPASCDDRARAVVLDGARKQAMISFAFWAIAAASLVPLWLVDFPSQPRIYLAHLVGLVLGTGLVASTFIFYFVEWSDREHLIPKIFPDGIGDLPGARSVSIHTKIGLLIFTTSTIPILGLLSAASLSHVDTRSLLFMGGSFGIFGAVQAYLIRRSVDRPIRTLLGEVDRVRRNDLSARAHAVSADAIGRLGDGFNAMVDGLRRARFVEETFGRYVTPQVRDEILAGKIPLGGERRRATVLFCDVRGFTALSEKLQPEEVVQILNRYLDLMVEILVDEGATIDKFLGDGILAVFGVPLAQDDGARRAVRAALAMLARLDEWNQEREAAGAPPLAIGIGVHAGEVIAGNIGSARKMEYTIIGDAVNTASRIEGLNRQLGTRLLISADVHVEVAADVDARELDPVEVRGKSKPLLLYEVRPTPSASSRTARPAPTRTA
jgi:adenylate cyclase